MKTDTLSYLQRFLLCSFLFISGFSQSPLHAQEATKGEETAEKILPCGVICGNIHECSENEHEHCEGNSAATKSQSKKARNKRFVPAKVDEPITNKLLEPIKNVYVYRLALCVSAPMFSQDFHNDKAEAERWLDKTVEDLNVIYMRHVGIKFVRVKRDELLLTAPTSLTYHTNNGTKIIDKLIGNDSYDVGMLLHNSPIAGVAGLANLGGVRNNHTKGDSHAMNIFTTIAHEIGHLFNAWHTHNGDYAYNAEPGMGQSIMSYGSPRTFFSLFSVKQMRTLLSQQSYYKNSQRRAEDLVRKNSVGDNRPYIEPIDAVAPVIDTVQLKREYVVTKGTFFQLNVPLQNPDAADFLYTAQPYDVTKPGTVGNGMQPLYIPDTQPVKMFQPYYDEAQARQAERSEVPPVEHSDQFNYGIYTYILAASHQASYDTYQTRIRIVEGPEFKITSSLSSEYRCGRQLTVNWNPCTEVYGQNSRVRILMSDNFGQTFKYVLADNLPNNGSWSGTWPYININMIDNYRDYTKSIRGGLIKIEVKGEAAYAISHIYPLSRQGSEVIYSGGFTLANRNKSYFQEIPPMYQTFATKEQVPAMKPLMAYNSNSPTQTIPVNGSEVINGNKIIRTWKATVAGSEISHQQTIEIKVVPSQDLLSRLALIAHTAHLLYKNIGTLGYPKSSLQATTIFLQNYEKVYDEKQEIRADAQMEDAAALEKSMQTLSKINDADIVLPEAGKVYTIHNYQWLFGRPRLWYIKNDGYTETLTNDATTATQWVCEKNGSKFRFRQAEKSISLANLTTNTEWLNLERGYCWGTFAFSNDFKRSVEVTQEGNMMQQVRRDDVSITDYHTNNNGNTISTDFKFIQTGTVTGINVIEKERGEQTIYDLQGRRLSRIVQPGIYIVNGKKVTIK
ncbi:MAG: M12 family metallo-peptidase [Prevotella sp.]|nr:M12 family metallo-peptidase [Prevotella sp.]